MRVSGLGKAQLARQIRLRGSGEEQIIAAYHLIHPLESVVNHHRQVVGHRPVTALQHHAINRLTDLPVQLISGTPRLHRRTQTQRRGATQISQTLALGLPLRGRQVQTRARIETRWRVRGARRCRDVTPRTVALEQAARGLQLRQRS